MIFKTKPRITQYFSDNPQFYGQWGLWGHEGIDIVPTGQDWTIYSWMDGRVEQVYESQVYGKTIIIHERVRGISWRLAHLERIDVRVHDLVIPGDTLGVMGATPYGRSGIGGLPMAAHLHVNCVPMRRWGQKDFEKNGFKGRVDPLGVLRDRGEL